MMNCYRHEYYHYCSGTNVSVELIFDIVDPEQSVNVCLCGHSTLTKVLFRVVCFNLYNLSKSIRPCVMTGNTGVCNTPFISLNFFHVDLE
jgi:hypothetical protein